MKYRLANIEGITLGQLEQEVRRELAGHLCVYHIADRIHGRT